MDLCELRAEGTVGSRHPWELARTSVVSRILTRTIGPSFTGILDLGCGDVFLAEYLSERFPGCSIAAVDTAFDSATKQAVQARLANKPITLYDSLDEVQRSFSGEVELVLLLDVIEHVDDDVGLLRTLQRYAFVRRDAWVLITAPAFSSLYGNHDRFLGHYRRYTNRTLVDCALRAGYRTVRSGYFFASLLLPRYLEVRRERATDPVPRSDRLLQWQGGALRTRVLRTALLLDFELGWILRRAGLNCPGLSNYLLCQRSA